MPAGTTADQAGAITDTIERAPLAIQYGGNIVTSTGASTSNDGLSGATDASVSVQAFPALVTVAAAAIFALAL